MTKKIGYIALFILSALFFFCGAVFVSGCSSDPYAGVSFENVSVVYDGSEHEILIGGELPAGASVEYENNTRTDAGTTSAVAIIKDKNGEEKKRLTATLTVTSASVEKPVLPQVTAFTYTGEEINLNIESGEKYTVYNAAAKEVGKYTAVIALNDPVNYSWADGTKASIACEWSINSYIVEKPVIAGTYVYTGSEQRAQVAESSYYTLYNATATNAGTYSVIAVLNNPSECCWADGTSGAAELSWTIEKQSVEKPAVTGTYTYNGEEQTAHIAESALYTVHGATATNAGSYTATAELKDTVNYCWADGTSGAAELIWTIEKQPVEKPVVTGTYAYNGEEQTALITESALYTVVGATATNAGSYTATAELKDAVNYCWADGTSGAAELSWTIEKQPVEKPVVTGTYAYNGEEQTALITESALYTVVGATATNAGSYTATAELKDTINYCWTDGTAEALLLEWQIKKGVYDLSQTSFENAECVYNGAPQYNYITGELPAGITPVYWNNGGTNAGSYAGTVSFETDGNWEPIDDMLTATLTIKKAEYDMSAVSFDDAQFVYDKTEHELAVSGDLPEGVTVVYSDNKLTGSKTAVAQATATAQFSGDFRNFEPIPSMSAVIKVVPATQTVLLDGKTDDGAAVYTVYRYTTLSELAVDYRKTGYDFVGWRNEEGELYDPSLEIERDLALSAEWEAKTYTVSLDPDGGNADIEELTVAYGEKYALPLPVKAGFSFAGWYTDNYASSVGTVGVWYFDSEEHAISLIAVWTYSEYIGESGVFVSATESNIEIIVSGIGAYAEGYAELIAVDAQSYYTADTARGLSKNVDGGDDVVADYLYGTTQKFVFGRTASDGSDYYFKKYYLIGGDAIIKGPVYATDVTATYTAEGAEGYGSWQTKSKKGILDENTSITIGLGCSYAEQNFVLNGLIAPNETVDASGNVTKIDNSGDSSLIPYESNGKTYYFRKSALSYYDTEIKQLSDAKIKITLIVYATYTQDQNQLPYFMTYASARSRQTTLMAINTSNEIGAGYWIAAMKFISERYASGEHGYVQSYVISNEIDLAGSWNPILNESEEALPTLEVYAEEYYRQLRLASLAVTETDNDYVVLVPFTHYWASKGPGWAYSPLSITEALIKLSTEQGNFNWGFALHPYSSSMAESDIFYDDTKNYSVTNDIRTTNALTFTNFELFDLYLKEEAMLYRGNIRPVYITEAGINSSSNETEQKRQAAGIAYTYYKFQMLDCVVAYNYYRMRDIPAEGACFGIMTENFAGKKLSYNVWEQIDATEDTSLFNSYISSCRYVNKSVSSAEISFTESDTYLTVLVKIADALGIDYDWESKWNEYYGA